MKVNASEISNIIKKKLSEMKISSDWEEVGSVLQVYDGVCSVHGLENAKFGELVEFETGVKGLVLGLYEETVGVVVLGEDTGIKESSVVTRTNTIAAIGVNENLIGRVLNTLGNPIDGKGEIEGKLYSMPLERQAPGVIYRQSVDIPLQTGITAIDSMIPIGRGQRELIIGDRQTGKTSIALDTILNQKSFYESGHPVYCIYVAIGQKASTVLSVVNELDKKGAMNYTIVVAATASDTPALQYYAPFAGVAIGEYFRDTGRHALVIFDDLSKQAVAYREVSLLLRRPPGREAFPGDIFYLHSRLLERAAMINKNDIIAADMNDLPLCLKNKVLGGGSLTALPIIETQAGDVSAYIPTNVISITDGQIFLESDLFNAGIRPAINVGISVSRVGGAAQLKPMKKVAGGLKLNQAQYRELEAFAKFGSDLDDATKQVISDGEKNQELLKQELFSPISLGLQVAILYISNKGLLNNISLDRIKHFEYKYMDVLESNYREILQKVEAGDWDASIKEAFIEAAKMVPGF